LIALAAKGLTIADAQAFDDIKYSEWYGQWRKSRRTPCSGNWSSSARA